MKQTVIFFTVFICVSLLISCGDRQQENKPETAKETPKALQDENLEIKSFSRSSNDLLEDLYQELVNKTPSLKKLEKDIIDISPKTGILEEKYNAYNTKSFSYYTAASLKAASINDSVLKQKMIDLITNSKNKYSKKTKELNQLLKQISENNTTINDRHAVLKIVLTLPLIEKYQNDNLPDKKELKDLINQQGKLIEHIDSLSHKY